MEVIEIAMWVSGNKMNHVLKLNKSGNFRMFLFVLAKKSQSGGFEIEGKRMEINRPCLCLIVRSYLETGRNFVLFYRVHPLFHLLEIIPWLCLTRVWWRMYLFAGTNSLVRKCSLDSFFWEIMLYWSFRWKGLVHYELV